RKRARLRADAPHVEIMNIIDAIDLAHGCFHEFQFYSARSAFEQDVQSLAHDPEARPENQRADSERERGIDPILSGCDDDPAAHDYGGGGQGGANFMKKRPADFQFAAGADG